MRLRYTCGVTAFELAGISLLARLICTLRLFKGALLEAWHSNIDEAMTLADHRACFTRRIASATWLLCGLVHSGAHSGRLGHQLI